MCTGNNNAVMDRDYIRNSVMIWETVPFNLFQWEEGVSEKLQLVPSPLPDDLVFRTRAESRFAENIAAKVSAREFYSEMDANRRIDILFYGNSNEHRETLFLEFTELAKTHNLRIEFMMNISLFGSYRESLIDQAKVR
jgi:hypothetical protein